MNHRTIEIQASVKLMGKVVGNQIPQRNGGTISFIALHASETF
jgi:hypothetical protein